MDPIFYKYMMLNISYVLVVWIWAIVLMKIRKNNKLKEEKKEENENMKKD